MSETLLNDILLIRANKLFNIEWKKNKFLVHLYVNYNLTQNYIFPFKISLLFPSPSIHKDSNAFSITLLFL
jgi:hypothetical protein